MNPLLRYAISYTAGALLAAAGCEFLLWRDRRRTPAQPVPAFTPQVRAWRHQYGADTAGSN